MIENRRRAPVSLGVLIVVLAAGVSARERTRSGTYQNGRSSGSFNTHTSRTRTAGQRTTQKNTTLENGHGQATRNSQTTVDKVSGKGEYTSTMTGSNGKSVTREGVVTRNEDNSFTREGTVTGPGGKTTNVQSTVKKNENGSADVTKTYTAPDGSTVGVTKTIQKTESGRSVTGATDNGKSWTKDVSHQRQGNTVTKNVTTGAGGETKSRSSDVTIDTPAGEPVPEP